METLMEQVAAVQKDQRKDRHLAYRQILERRASPQDGDADELAAIMRERGITQLELEHDAGVLDQMDALNTQRENIATMLARASETPARLEEARSSLLTLAATMLARLPTAKLLKVTQLHLLSDFDRDGAEEIVQEWGRVGTPLLREHEESGAAFRRADRDVERIMETRSTLMQDNPRLFAPAVPFAPERKPDLEVPMCVAPPPGRSQTEMTQA